MGEVGPELQYWIPYLLNLKKLGVFKEKRLIVISRGGTEDWYHFLNSEYIEIFDYLTPENYNIIKNARELEKQVKLNIKENELVKLICQKNNITNYSIIHPKIMWNDVLKYFRSEKASSWVLKKLTFKPILDIDSKYSKIVDSYNLPKSFFFVRFYKSYLFDINKDQLNKLIKLIQGNSKQINLVTFGMSDNIDNHESYKLKEGTVIDLTNKISLKDNLGIQTEILRRSQGFFGTYGGISILPVFLAKPCFCFYKSDLGEFYDLHFKHEVITTKWYQDSKINYQTLTYDNVSHLLKLLS